MTDYSQGRELDFRIAKEILNLEVIDGTWTYIEPGHPEPLVVDIPAYSSNHAAVGQLIATLRGEGWSIEVISGGTLSRHGTLFKSGVGYFVEHPRNRGAQKQVVVAGDLCAAASAIMRAADLAKDLESGHPQQFMSD